MRERERREKEREKGREGEGEGEKEREKKSTAVKAVFSEFVREEHISAKSGNSFSLSSGEMDYFKKDVR